MCSVRPQIEFGNIEQLIPIGANIRLKSDSLYVVGVINGKFKPMHDTLLASVLIHLWNRASVLFVLGPASWTKAHVGTPGNELADTLAKAGESGTHFARQDSRPFSIEGVLEEDALAEVLNAHPMPQHELLHHTKTRKKQTHSDDFRLFPKHPIRLYKHETEQSTSHFLPRRQPASEGDDSETDLEGDDTSLPTGRVTSFGLALPTLSFFGKQ